MRRRVLWSAGLLALGGLLVAASVPAFAVATQGPNVSDATPSDGTVPVDGGDDESDGDGDTNLQSQQSNSDSDVLNLVLLDGNSAAVDVLGSNTSSGDGGDTDNQENENRQVCYG